MVNTHNPDLIPVGSGRTRFHRTMTGRLAASAIALVGLSIGIVSVTSANAMTPPSDVTAPAQTPDPKQDLVCTNYEEQDNYSPALKNNGRTSAVQFDGAAIQCYSPNHAFGKLHSSSYTGVGTIVAQRKDGAWDCNASLSHQTAYFKWSDGQVSTIKVVVDNLADTASGVVIAGPMKGDIVTSGSLDEEYIGNLDGTTCAEGVTGFVITGSLEEPSSLFFTRP